MLYKVILNESTANKALFMQEKYLFIIIKAHGHACADYFLKR